MKLFESKTRNERLADHYLAVSGVAAIAIDAAGVVSVVQPVTVDQVSGLHVVCCSGMAEALHLARAQSLYGNMSIEDRAALMGIGCTPHADVVIRAMAAVDAVNATIKKWQDTGGMAQINSAFKARRKAEPGLRYQDWLHRHKELLLETMAKELSQ